MFKVFLVSVGLKGKLLCSGCVYLAVIPDLPKETDHETFYFVSFWRGGVRVLQEAAEDSLPVPTSHLSLVLLCWGSLTRGQVHPQFLP